MCFLDGIGDDDEGRRQNLHVLRVTAACRHALANVRPEGASVVACLRDGEDHLGCLGGELPAIVGRAGLDDHRPSLDRPRDVQRAAHGKELALVVKHMQLGRIEELAGLLVPKKGVVGPAVPEPVDDIHELARTAGTGPQWGIWSVMPKFSAASGLDVVTTFHPARPPLM